MLEKLVYIYVSVLILRFILVNGTLSVDQMLRTVDYDNLS
jgi:hypothetical protein